MLTFIKWETDDLDFWVLRGCGCFFPRNFLSCLLVKSPSAKFPQVVFFIFHSPIFLPPHSLSLLRIPFEINHNCLLSQHEDHLTGIYPEIPAPCLSASWLQHWGEEGKSPAARRKVPGPPSAPRIWHDGPHPPPSCPAAGEETHTGTGRFKTPTPLKQKYSTSPSSCRLPAGRLAFSKSQSPDDK